MLHSGAPSQWAVICAPAGFPGSNPELKWHPISLGRVAGFVLERLVLISRLFPLSLGPQVTTSNLRLPRLWTATQTDYCHLSCPYPGPVSKIPLALAVHSFSFLSSLCVHRHSPHQFKLVPLLPWGFPGSFLFSSLMSVYLLRLFAVSPKPYAACHSLICMVFFFLSAILLTE